MFVASAKIQRLLTEKMEDGALKLKDLLASCRRVTICVDGWSKKALSASFLGISACFFEPTSFKPQHAFLSLDLLFHPHTGAMLSTCIETSLQKWGITKEKVMLVVSDNGKNMIRAIRLLGENAANNGLIQETVDDVYDVAIDDGENEDSEEDQNETENDDPETDVAENLQDIPYRRLGCLAHTLHLIVKAAYEGEYKELLVKTRKLVGKIRKSSVTMERIRKKCGKSVIADNTTRWNSTYFLAKRLLEIKAPLNEVLGDLEIDSLVASEWSRLENLVSLLEPFAIQTNTLQTDALSLSHVIPSVLDLDAHLDQLPFSQSLAQSMQKDLRMRFAVLLTPDHPNFNPLPVAATLLDPTCASVILGFDQTRLRESAKSYIMTQVTTYQHYHTHFGNKM